jgi:hypothetical protein
MLNLYDIFRNEGLSFYNREKFSLENYKSPEYQDGKEEIDSSEIFENPYKKQQFRPCRKLDWNWAPKVFKYFIDGSRKVYIVGEIITEDKKFLPIVAGQVATACCERENKKLKVFTLNRINILTIPDRLNEDKFERIKEKIHKKIINSRFNKDNINWQVAEYKLKGNFDGDNTKIEDKGTAKIQEVMHSNEVKLIHKMAKSGALQENSMLVIDGSLRFERQTTKIEPEYFKNVISIAKSFDPHKTNLLKQKNKEIGVYLTDLPYGHRTPVFKICNTQSNHKFGTWYIRIREPKYMKNPLEGIVKIEKLAVTEEEDRYGFCTDLIDNISSYLLAERVPTCYGNDTRWACHIYPIFLTERLVKSSFLSDTYFLNIF